MPDFKPNSLNANATIPVFPKETYEFRVVSFKPSKSVKENDQKEQVEKYGITCMVECISSGVMAGKKVPRFFGFQDNQLGFWKKYMMAVYDYPINDDGEARFDQEVLLEKDESINFDTLEMGSYYKDAVGRVFISDVDEQKYKGNRQNVWSDRGVSSSIPAPETVTA